MKQEVQELRLIKLIKSLIRNYGKSRKPMINTTDFKNSNNEKEVLFMKLSKLSTRRRFSMLTV